MLDKEKDAEKYEQSVLDRHSAVVISLLVDIRQEIPEDQTWVIDLLQPEDKKFLSGYEEYEKNKDRPWDAKIASDREDAKVLIIDVKDAENLFAQRYQRMTPMIIKPHDSRTEEGILKSFTILFQHVCAFSFT